MKIESQHIDIHPETKIADDVEIVASDSVSIGRWAVIKSGFKVRCRSLNIGYHTYIGQNVEVGGGGCDGVNADVKIGARSLIADRCFINCAEKVTIGEHVAFGYETQVWTHGVWQPIIEGFSKMKQEPVVIGDEVWLPSRCQVLPGVTIGPYVVVGMGSLVNKDLPSGCLAVGHPAKVIKENVYPKRITHQDVRIELERIVPIYLELAKDKGFEPEVTLTDGCTISFCHGGKRILFDPWTQTMGIASEFSEYAEDFRDFLRRWGFPFYGGGFFRSIEPQRFKEMDGR